MSVFTYTLPSGSTFRMTAPEGTTQLQADLIFYSQVAAGALVGYSPGQTLTSAATAMTKFAPSRQDRGTAGVDTQAILAIINNIPATAGIPALINTPLTNPINQANLVNINSGGLTPNAIGPLSSSQVQGILAQIANLVDQPATVMSDDKGVGQYGLSCVQLEQAGYVKPGTWQRFIFDPEPMSTVLSAPGTWTGQDGVTSVQEFLDNPGIQTQAQTALLRDGYNGLVSAGVITPTSTQAITVSQGQVYTQSGLQSLSNLSAATGASLAVPSAVAQSLANTPYAQLLSSPLTNVKTITSGAINTLNNAQTTLTNISGIASNLTNTAVGEVGALVANAGRFGTAAATAWSQLSTDPVGAISGSVNNLISGTVNNITGTINNTISGVTNTINTVTNTINTVTALPGQLATNLSNLTSSLDITGKAAQFATAFSTPLASLSNLGNFDLSSINNNIASLTSGLTNTLTGGINNITGSLTTSLDTITGSLTSGIGGITDSLSGSLTSLSGSLSGSLTNLTGSLGDLTGGLSAGLGSITSSLTEGLGSLGDFSSLSSLGDLGGLGALGGIFGGGGDDLVSGTKVAAGYSNTVNRATLDVAMTKIIGSTKVPTPLFDFPSINSISLNASADITAAANILQNIKSQGGALLSQVQNVTNSVTNIANAGSPGGIITNVTNAINSVNRLA
jgi:hypothetical protein